MLRLSASPVMRQKLGYTANRITANASEDIFEPGKWIYVHTLARSHEAAQHGSRPTADIAAEKQPIARPTAIPRMLCSVRLAEFKGRLDRIF